MNAARLAEVAVEARVRFGDFGIVPFRDAGNIYTSPWPEFTGRRYGAGLGVRYYTSFGRLGNGFPFARKHIGARSAKVASLSPRSLKTRRLQS